MIDNNVRAKISKFVNGDDLLPESCRAIIGMIVTEHDRLEREHNALLESINVSDRVFFDHCLIAIAGGMAARGDTDATWAEGEAVAFTEALAARRKQRHEIRGGSPTESGEIRSSTTK